MSANCSWCPPPIFQASCSFPGGRFIPTQHVVALARHGAVTLVVSRPTTVEACIALGARRWHHQQGRVTPRDKRTLALVTRQFIQVQIDGAR